MPRMSTYSYLACFWPQTDRRSQKRYARLMKVQDEGASSGSIQNGSPKPKAAPKNNRSKNEADDTHENGDALGDDSPSPKKKQRVTKAKKVDVKEDNSTEDSDGD